VASVYVVVIISSFMPLLPEYKNDQRFFLSLDYYFAFIVVVGTDICLETGFIVSAILNQVGGRTLTDESTRSLGMAARAAHLGCTIRSNLQFSCVIRNVCICGAITWVCYVAHFPLFSHVLLR